MATTKKSTRKRANQALSAAFTCGACVYCFNRSKAAETALCSRTNGEVAVSDNACPHGERRRTVTEEEA